MVKIDELDERMMEIAKELQAYCHGRGCSRCVFYIAGEGNSCRFAHGNPSTFKIEETITRRFK